MSVDQPRPDLAQLAVALERLEAALTNSPMPANEHARAFLLDRVHRIRAKARVEVIAGDPTSSHKAILGLLTDWVEILVLLRRLDVDVPATRQ
jgi:hypothetical protein